MDTKLATQSRNVNAYAENIISRHELILPEPFALPCSALTHDGYPNLAILELDQVPVKTIEWFTNQVGQNIFVASHDAESGILKIEGNNQAEKLCASRDYGYKFLTLVERLKQFTGRSYYDPAFQEPKINKLYTYSRYLNGELQESHKVCYLGLTDNLKWYLFQFPEGADRDGNTHHLLPVGEFPHYKKQLTPGAIHFEQYTSYLSIVK